ncbi:response regulator transcription factor [Actinomadura yumaensis]|uniref:response regulator transcription factor n=1 Tax=Actinomadura yumaensis TaxID=111807 RepID=UPI00360B6DFF
MLRLVTAGRSNRQIAEELFISPKTASVHVSRILTKLDVATRGEAAALAHRLRLFPSDGPLGALRMGSDLDQLGEGRRDPHLLGPEVDDDGGIADDVDDAAEAVLVVADPVVDLVLLDGRGRGRWFEGTGRQVSPRGGSRCFHHCQYAPCWAITGRSLPNQSPRVPSRGGAASSRNPCAQGFSGDTGRPISQDAGTSW